ncbi:hypothetical protein RRG08_016080 [Elysia crispata]|uniref:Uncharacterized protein n=1 Tax=Elysia crispata TaxID=231223 RepID=A0AAE1DJD7_9GAST|nr:hypothetical protein RRG08_016080 [Elysia crispata]
MVEGLPRMVDGLPRIVDGLPRMVERVLRMVDDLPRMVERVLRMWSAVSHWSWLQLLLGVTWQGCVQGAVILVSTIKVLQHLCKTFRQT